MHRRVSAIAPDAIGLVDLSTHAIETGLLLRVTSKESLAGEVLERFLADGHCDLIRKLNPVLSRNAPTAGCGCRSRPVMRCSRTMGVAVPPFGNLLSNMSLFAANSVKMRSSR